MKEQQNNLNKAINALKNEPVPPGPPQQTIDVTLKKLGQAAEKPHTTPVKKQTKATERIKIMKNLAKIAAAAAIIIAALIGISRFGGSIDGASVAWADVLNVMEQVPTVVFKMTTVITFSEKNRELSTKSEVYDGGEYGNRVDIYMNGQLTMQKFLLPKEKVAYRIQPKEKMYSRFVLSENQAATEGDMPRQWVEIILSEDYVELGKGNINGIEVEGVEVQNSQLLGGDEGIVRLWVDVETNLPVRMELEGKMMESGAKRPTKHVMEDFQWDVQLDANIFEPDIPDDYTEIKQQKKPEVNEPSKNLSDDEKREKPVVKEVAEAIFRACADKDWDEFSKLWPALSLNKMQKLLLGGLEIISVGEPFKSTGSSTWYVPYEIRLKFGEVKKKDLRVSYDKATKRYVGRGGL
jgi:hypothetical protein